MKNYLFLAIGIFYSFLVNISSASDRIIIKYKSVKSQQTSNNTGIMNNAQSNFQKIQPLSLSKIDRISQMAGSYATEVNQVANGAHVLKFRKNLSDTQMNQVLVKLKANKDVDYVEVDRILKPTNILLHNSLQWDMRGSSMAGSARTIGDNFIEAWDYWNKMYPGSQPGDNVVIAVIDTGYTPHPKLLNSLVPSVDNCTSDNGVYQCYGYQFISDCRIAGTCPSNTSDSISAISPQPDGLDRGDFITDSENERGFFEGCGTDSSSWHGTHVTGTLVAGGFSGGGGILGGAYGAKVLPLRALGKCGGYSSDIANAILYAVNQYPGIYNPNKAQVINMSLGAAYQCNTDITTQSAINTAVANGAIVIAAAGNSSENVNNFTPAGCKNVVSVAAKGFDNKLAWYSNFGNTTITASGGNNSSSSNTQADTIYSTLWASENTFNPKSGGTYVYYEGTSMAAPHVSAAVADVISLLKAKSETYTNSKLVSILQNSASFKYNGNTSNNGFGLVSTGMLDVGNAILYADIYYDQMLTPNTSSANVYMDVPSDVVFTNNQAQSVEVKYSNLAQIDSVVMQSNTCNDIVLEPGQSCTVTIARNDTGSEGDTLANLGSLQVVNNDDVVVASTPVLYSETNAPILSGVSGLGGGCSVVKDTKDISLILILLGLAVIYIRNNLCTNRKNNKV
ncbi:MAG: S8 family serine peptidase [Neisseriaceae bacterium]|jgi:serine protease